MEPGGTHYKVHKVGKKLAAHGGVKVGERLSDTEMDMLESLVLEFVMLKKVP